MLKTHLLALAIAAGVGVGPAWSSPFADTVVSYQAGSAGAGALTNASAALGAPATAIHDPVWGDSLVTPFNAPYLPDQIVSVGAGGSLTLGFANPISNEPHPYGLDFLIFGNTMFIDAAWPKGQTDATGSTFGENTGRTELWVSENGSEYYRLNPSLAPVVDGFFPTDGQGAPGLPVNPGLTRAAFAGMTLAQVRSLYGGSAGGTGFDLAWAQDANGQSVILDSIRFVRLDVISGSAEIDAVVAVPEPAVWALAGVALPVFLIYHRCNRRRHISF